MVFIELHVKIAVYVKFVHMKNFISQEKGHFHPVIFVKHLDEIY